MPESEVHGEWINVLRFLNETQSTKEVARVLKEARVKDAEKDLAASILNTRASVGGAFQDVADLQKAGLTPADISSLARILNKELAELPKIQAERTQFRSLLLENPNYFGNFENSELQPVKKIQGNTSFEEMTCVGLNPPFDRLEAVVRINKSSGYGGGICGDGSLEFVRFYVDLHDDGNLHDVGLASVRVHDIPGAKPLCYAVYLDFDAIRKRCTAENIVRVRAILSWSVPPPAGAPNHVPVWGNHVDVSVQIHPRFIFPFPVLIEDLKKLDVSLTKPALNLLESIDPESKLQLQQSSALTVAAKRDLYKKEKVPASRFAFAEGLQLLSGDSPTPQLLGAPSQSALTQIGLEAAEIKDLLGVLKPIGDGNTSYEELTCVGLKPEQDMLEAVINVKKKSGYSGKLCGDGSTEYVAFWIDFGDGFGFQHVGTTSVAVHDLQQVPKDGLQYAVFLKTDLSNRLIPCQYGARVVRVRAILSWQSPPPPGNPNWVPHWGNREECRIQLRPRVSIGHTPLIETVGDVGINDINQTNGLASGAMVLASASLEQAPFGGGIAITGRIGSPPDSYGGGATPFKYKIEVAPDGTSDWQTLVNKITVKKSEFVNGVPVQCAPFDYVCDVSLTPTDDGDGLGPGWYEYIEDLAPPQQRFLIVDLLGRWQTNASMEGLWKIRITAKDPSTSPPSLYPGAQIVKIRVDNTEPTVSLAITGATLNGNPIPAVACGKFPKGAIIEGTFSVHDPGAASSAAAFQHYSNAEFGIQPSGPASGAAAVTVPAVRSFPTVGTTGLSGTWTIDTQNMSPCGYVLTMTGVDRTNVNSRGVHFRTPISVGFCVEEPV